MLGCKHVYESKGKFYRRQDALLGGQVFTVYRYRECVHCNKQELTVVQKKRITESADRYESQLKFSGVKPENLLN